MGAGGGSLIDGKLGDGLCMRGGSLGISLSSCKADNVAIGVTIIEGRVG